MAIEHFLAIASVLIFLSCPSQYYCCDGGKLHIVNDFCACCFAHILQKALSRLFFVFRLSMSTSSESWAFASDFSVSVNVRDQNHSVKGSLVPKKEHCTKVLDSNSDPTS